jgi:predicted secreted acid phosphatase
MKQRARIVPLLVVALLVAGCASTAATKNYQAISTCNAAAQAATQAFGVLYQQHKAEDPALWADRYDKAQAAYKSYQAIASAAVDVAASGGDLTVTLAAVNQALAQLTQTLASFGVK